MCLCLFLLKLKPVFDLSVIFFNFWNIFWLSLLLFHDFLWPSLKFHDFPGLEIETINSMTFQVFHDLYKPCNYSFYTTICQGNSWSSLIFSSLIGVSTCTYPNLSWSAFNLSVKMDNLSHRILLHSLWKSNGSYLKCWNI